MGPNRMACVCVDREMDCCGDNGAKRFEMKDARQKKVEKKRSRLAVFVVAVERCVELFWGN